MINALLMLVIYLLVLGLIFWLLNYLISIVPLPEPFHTTARVVLAVVAVIIVILLLLQLVGGSPQLPKLSMLGMLV